MLLIVSVFVLCIETVEFCQTNLYNFFLKFCTELNCKIPLWQDFSECDDSKANRIYMAPGWFISTKVHSQNFHLRVIINKFEVLCIFHGVKQLLFKVCEVPCAPVFLLLCARQLMSVGNLFLCVLTLVVT